MAFKRGTMVESWPLYMSILAPGLTCLLPPFNPSELPAESLLVCLVDVVCRPVPPLTVLMWLTSILSSILSSNWLSSPAAADTPKSSTLLLLEAEVASIERGILWLDCSFCICNGRLLVECAARFRAVSMSSTASLMNRPIAKRLRVLSCIHKIILHCQKNTCTHKMLTKWQECGRQLPDSPRTAHPRSTRQAQLYFQGHPCSYQPGMVYYEHENKYTHPEC